MAIVQEIQANEGIHEGTQTKDIQNIVIPMLEHGFGIQNIERIYDKYKSIAALEYAKMLALKGYNYGRILNILDIIAESNLLSRYNISEYIDNMPTITTRNKYMEELKNIPSKIKAGRKYLKRCRNREKLFRKKKQS